MVQKCTVYILHVILCDTSFLFCYIFMLLDLQVFWSEKGVDMQQQFNNQAYYLGVLVQLSQPNMLTCVFKF